MKTFQIAVKFFDGTTDTRSISAKSYEHALRIASQFDVTVIG